MGRDKIKKYVAKFISLLPTNLARVTLYRLLFQYEIKSSFIGWNTCILVNKFKVNKTIIGEGNSFLGPIDVEIKANSNIGDNNKFVCGWWVLDKKFKNSGFKRKITIDTNCLITSGHYIDLAGSFSLGKESWIAGYASQFWTHGVGVKDRNITIGEKCYIGSAVRFSPGSTIANNTLIAMGSVVTKKFEKNKLLIGGNPAKIIKENYKW